MEGDAEIPTIVLKSESDEENECCCIIEQLAAKPFNLREYADQFRIVTNGRPTPLVPIETKTKNCIRRLKDNHYELCKWLCGCLKSMKLYCWPCTLFARIPGVWTKTGINDINNLVNLQKRHEIGEEHIQSTLLLKNFGCELEDTFRVDIEKFNQSVKRNRHVVSRLIDVLCCLAQAQLPVQSHCFGKAEMDYFRILTDFLRHYDDNFDTHISNCNTFSKLSKVLQKDLIDSVYEVFSEEIQDQISNYNFFSIIIDEITDHPADKCLISSIIRFTDLKGDVYERFIGFNEYEKMPELITHLSSLLLNKLNSSKLIAVSCNGPSFMSLENSGMSEELKMKHKRTYFVHYHSHKIFSILKNCVHSIPECRIFFWTLNRLCCFFLKSSERNFALLKEIKKRFPKISFVLRWELDSKLVTSVFNYRIEIIRILDAMVKNCDKWGMETYNEAGGLLSSMKDFKFNFMLHLFSDIFPQAESFFELLEESKFDVKCCTKGIEEFKKHLDNLRCDYNNFWLQLEGSSYSIASGNSYKKLKFEGEEKELYKNIYCDVIITLLRIVRGGRFGHMENLDFIGLLDTTKFQDFSKHFPLRRFCCLKESIYFNLFDLGKIKNELSVLYKTESFRKENVFELHKFLCKNNYREVIPEVCKLGELIVTLPVMAASSDEFFSGHRRVQDFLKNHTSEINFFPMSLLSIENSFLLSLKSNPKFYDKVIEKLSKKSRHMELIYKTE